MTVVPSDVHRDALLGWFAKRNERGDVMVVYPGPDPLSGPAAVDPWGSRMGFARYDALARKWTARDVDVPTLGMPDAVLLPTGDVVITWHERVDNLPHAYWARIDADLQMADPVELGAGSPARVGTLDNGTVIAVWHPTGFGDSSVWSADLDVFSGTHTYPRAIGRGTSTTATLVTRDDQAFHCWSESSFSVARRDANGWAEAVALAPPGLAWGSVLTQPDGGAIAILQVQDTERTIDSRRFEPAEGKWGEPTRLWTGAVDEYVGFFADVGSLGHAVVSVALRDEYQTLHYDPNRGTWEPGMTLEMREESMEGYGQPSRAFRLSERRCDHGIRSPRWDGLETLRGGSAVHR